MRPLLEEMEDRLRHEKRLKYSSFCGLAASELLGVKYHISQIEDKKDSVKTFDESAIRAALCLLNYDKLKEEETCG